MSWSDGMAEHRRRIGETYLRLSALGCALMAAALLALPPGKTSGAALRVLYGIAPRATWGVAFLLLTGLCLATLKWPTEDRFVLTTAVLIGSQTAWAVGLSAPLFTAGPANALAIPAWVQLAASGIVVARLYHRPRRR